MNMDEMNKRNYRTAWAEIPSQICTSRHASCYELFIQSNHSNAANATTMAIDDSSKWEAVPANATILHLPNELFKPKLP